MLRLDNDVKSLQSFANRAYSNEMNTQKMVLRDLLGGMITGVRALAINANSQPQASRIFYSKTKRRVASIPRLRGCGPWQ